MKDRSAIVLRAVLRARWREQLRCALSRMDAVEQPLALLLPADALDRARAELASE